MDILAYPVLVVTGGRQFSDYDFIFRALDSIPVRFGLLIHGDASGVDRICGEWATARRISQLPMPADWNVYAHTPKRDIRRRSDGGLYDVKAGFRRNGLMARYSKLTHGAIFPGWRGTAHMAERLFEVLPRECIFDFRGTYRGF